MGYIDASASSPASSGVAGPVTAPFQIPVGLTNTTGAGNRAGAFINQPNFSGQQSNVNPLTAGPQTGGAAGGGGGGLNVATIALVGLVAFVVYLFIKRKGGS